MSRIFDLITMIYGKDMENTQAQLEYEESSKMLANCQGNLSGMKQFMEFVIEEFGESYAKYNNDKIPTITELEDAILIPLYEDVKEMNSNLIWKDIESKVDNALNVKKNYLFYEADKGRDLDFCHGYRDGITHYRKICNDIRAEKEHRDKKEPLLKVLRG